jgi:acylphosphatase
MRIARRYLITGHVHGVGFRFFIESQAAIEGLNGWARNLHDGSVEVLFEGDAESVDRAEAKLRRGPAAARVEDVRVEDVPPSGRTTGFMIRG